MAELIWLVPLLPLVGVIVNGLVLSWMGPEVRQRYSGWIATAASALAFVIALAIALNLKGILGANPWRDVPAFTWIEIPGSLTIPAALRIDPLSVTMMLV